MFSKMTVEEIFKAGNRKSMSIEGNTFHLQFESEKSIGHPRFYVSGYGLLLIYFNH